MGMSDGKLVPKHLAGWKLGKRTMQDDDSLIPTPPPAGNFIITEGSDPIITEAGDNLITET